MTIRAASKTSGGSPPANCRTTTGTRTHPQAQSDALRGLPEQGGVKRAQREPSPARVSPTLAHVALPAAGRTVFPTTRGPPREIVQLSRAGLRGLYVRPLVCFRLLLLCQEGQ
jgi:hypothetical protein